MEDRRMFYYFNHCGIFKSSTNLLSWHVTCRQAREIISCQERICGDFLIIKEGGKLLSDFDPVRPHACLTVSLKLCGGKGGFGSLLRSFGNQIHKTSNMEACRDLSGRRMRDVNNERRLREWAAKQAERKEDDDKARREKRERILQGPRHEFNDPDFEKQNRVAVENVQDAVDQGLKMESTAGGSSACASQAVGGKRRGEWVEERCMKKAKFWLGPGLGEEDLGTSSEEEEAADDSDSASQFSISSSVYAMKGSDSEADLSGLVSDGQLAGSCSSSSLSTSLSQGTSTTAKASADRETSPCTPTTTASSSSPSDGGESVLGQTSSQDTTKSVPGEAEGEAMDSMCSLAVAGADGSGDVSNDGLSMACEVSSNDDADDAGMKPLNMSGTSGTYMFGSSDGPRDVESIKTDSTAMSSPDSSLADSESVKSVEVLNNKLLAKPDEENSSINLHSYGSAQELEELGLERLKVALTSLGLKCGGTLQERAVRLFSIKGVPKDKIDPTLFVKPQKGKKNRPS